jgi:hypothetical protein
MTSAPPNSLIERVGDTAGVIWKILNASGPMTMAKVVKAAGQPRDTVMLALGWLAREDKIHVEDDGRKRIVSLR